MFVAVGLAGIAVVAGLLVTAPAASSAGFVLEWSDPVQVSTPGNDASLATTVTSSIDGSRQAVSWGQVESALTRVYVAVSDDSGVTWDDSTALSVAGRNAAFADMAMTDDGLNMVNGWKRFDGSDWPAQATGSSDGGVTWSAPATLSAPVADIFNPDVAIAAQSTRRVMIWERGVIPRLIQATVSDDSASWATPVDLSAGSGNATTPKVAISDDGQQIVSVWSEFFSTFQIQTRVSRDGGATWDDSVTFPVSTLGSSANPQVAMSGDGVRVVTAWTAGSGPSNQVHVRTSDDSATTWNPIVLVDEAGMTASTPSLATSANGSVSSVAWMITDAGVRYVQVAVTTDGGVTWGAPITVSGGSGGVNAPRISMSQDGVRQAVVWNEGTSPNFVNRLSYSFDSGATWSEPFDLSVPLSSSTSPSVAVAGDGSGLVVGYQVPGVATSVVVRNARFVAAPTPTPPSPPMPASAPLNVVAAAGDASAVVSWQPPASGGSFPATNYQVSGSPSGSCLVPVATLSCEVTGLRNGEGYSFRVRALTGAGWGAWSSPVSVTPDVGKSILISGSRDEGSVVVSGMTTGLVGSEVMPWIRFPGPHRYEPGAGVQTVSDDGTFTWQRRTGKKTYVYFRADGDVRSNRVIIPAS
jgi:hypothetical protein